MFRCRALSVSKIEPFQNHELRTQLKICSIDFEGKLLWSKCSKHVFLFVCNCLCTESAKLGFTIEAIESFFFTRGFQVVLPGEKTRVSNFPARFKTLFCGLKVGFACCRFWGGALLTAFFLSLGTGIGFVPTSARF